LIADGGPLRCQAKFGSPKNTILRLPSRPCLRIGAGLVLIAGGLAAGLVVLPALPNVQFTVRADATPGVSFTLEAATHLHTPIPWTPIFTTNVSAMPFDYVDFDVKLSDKPRKFYRVRQP
jgi:hypothetical protein